MSGCVCTCVRMCGDLGGLDVGEGGVGEDGEIRNVTRGCLF